MSWLGRHLWVVAPSLLAAAALCALRDLEARPWATVAVLALAVAAFARALARLGGAAVPAGAVLAVAALLRLLLLPLPPTLSDDVHRYLWDGRVAVAGRNPYFHSPDDTALADLRDVLWERVAHRDVETVYPPLAIAAFSIASGSRRPLLAWKAILIAVDLLSCLLLLRLARVRGVASGRCLAYAWNPLVVLEAAGMGHVDALGVAPLVAGALLLDGRRSRVAPQAHSEAGSAPAEEPRMATAGPGPERRLAGAGACLGLAVLAKLVPILLVPAWTRSAARGTGWKRGAVLLGSCAAVVAVGVAPFAIGAPGLPPGLVTYAVSWEWNGPLFEPLWRLLDAAGAAPWVKARLDQVRDATGWHQALHRVYPLVYPQLLAKAILGSALLVVVLSSLRRADPVAAALRVFAGVLLLSATVYPWYALWVLPWAALEWRLPWLVLSSSLLASYLPRLLDVPLLPWPFLLVWSPFLYALWRARRQPTA